MKYTMLYTCMLHFFFSESCCFYMLLIMIPSSAHGFFLGSSGDAAQQLVPTVTAPSNSSAGENVTEVCEDTIDTCHQYGRTACTNKVYEAWIKTHCALHCGFCTPTVPYNLLCQDKLANCKEFDSGDLCTDASYYSWAYENCRGYCQFGQCNSSWCEDSKGYNCSFLELSENICANVDKAKHICKKHCELCNITDSNWCSWSAWSNCDVTCDNGTQTRVRQCACPRSSNGGNQCEGNSEEIESCTLESCPVNGGWTSWSNWSDCPVSCGFALKARTRTCTNPSPSKFGLACIGNSDDKDICGTYVCVPNTINVGWSTWSNWSSCPVTCGGALKTRTRTCTTLSPYSYACIGNSEDKDICGTAPCFTPASSQDGGMLAVDGGWTTWSNWSACSSDCEKQRTRNCTNPAPSRTGHMCLGSTLDKSTCNIASCAAPALHVRLVGGSTPQNGRLEVALDGDNWGTVCDDEFNYGAAQVACKMMGHSGAEIRQATSVPDGKGPIYLDNVICTGLESSLMFCEHNTWGSHNCEHHEDVGVACH